MRSPTSEETKVGSGTPDKRLDCWKEVASHLGRGERTVKRWEAERGLPIRRVPGAGRATIYAYTAELDEWLKSRGAQELEPDGEAVQEIAGTAEMTAVAESAAGATIVARDVSVELDHPTPEAKPLSRGLQRKWTFALASLALLGIAGAGIRLAALHHRGLSTPATGSQPSEKSQPTAGPGGAAVVSGSAVVSDADKRQAHDLYLKGRYEWNQRTPESLNRALDDFTQAVVHDPNSAQAYAGIADTYEMMRIYSAMLPSDVYPRAMGAASRAIQLDDSLSEAHRALALVESWGPFDFAVAEKEFRRAIELNPKDPLAHKWFADMLDVRHRFDESLEEINKAQELDPGSHAILVDKGGILLDAGRSEEGLAIVKQVERVAPELSSPHWYLMRNYWLLRDYPDYLVESEKMAETTNDPVLRDITSSARAGYARDGERGLLKNLFATEEKYHAEGRFLATRIALQYVQRGMKDEALRMLEAARADHDPAITSANLAAIYTASLNSSDSLVLLKDDPRFKALLKPEALSQPSGQTSPGGQVPADASHLAASR